MAFAFLAGAGEAAAASGAATAAAPAAGAAATGAVAGAEAGAASTAASTALRGGAMEKLGAAFKPGKKGLGALNIVEGAMSFAHGVLGTMFDSFGSANTNGGADQASEARSRW